MSEITDWIQEVLMKCFHGSCDYEHCTFKSNISLSPFWLVLVELWQKESLSKSVLYWLWSGRNFDTSMFMRELSWINYTFARICVTWRDSVLKRWNLTSTLFAELAKTEPDFAARWSTCSFNKSMDFRSISQPLIKVCPTSEVSLKLQLLQKQA